MVDIPPLPHEYDFPKTKEDLGFDNLPEIIQWLSTHDGQFSVEHKKNGGKVVHIEIIPAGWAYEDMLICRQTIPKEAFDRYEGPPADVLEWRIRLALVKLTAAIEAVELGEVSELT